MRQGEVYWLRFGGHCSESSEPSGQRPAVVIQHDRFNRSAIQTTNRCRSHLESEDGRRSRQCAPEKRGGELPRPSVVNVTRIRPIDRDKLGGPIGALSPRRIRQVLGGLSLVVGLDDRIVE